jgi:hypothetical protein
LVVKKLRLEKTEEAFHHTIVITVTFSGHAQLDPLVLEHLLVWPHLVLPALVRMEDQLGVIWNLLEGRFSISLICWKLGFLESI